MAERSCAKTPRNRAIPVESEANKSPQTHRGPVRAGILRDFVPKRWQPRRRYRAWGLKKWGITDHSLAIGKKKKALVDRAHSYEGSAALQEEACKKIHNAGPIHLGA